MNYEQKYKKALKIIESLYNVVRYQSSSDALLVSQTIEKAFPELHESEDERIRKALIRNFTNQHSSNFPTVEGFTREQILAWLEKQSEKKDTVTPQWMVDFLKDHRRHFATPMDYDEKKETDGKLLAVIKWLEGNPQLEQNHAWSEEDEKMLDSIIDCIDGLCFIDSDQLNWLKSIKFQRHWKPSEEQMEALKKRTHGLHTSSETRKALESLINDLEKL